MVEKVFINCPYDDKYLEIFKIIMYMCFRFGYEPVFAAESATSNNRMQVIEKLIKTTSFSIHDISRNDSGEYPRFNMPFELGMDYMYKCLKNKNKELLILDNLPNDYDKTLSDLSCLDVMGHQYDSELAVKILRDTFVKLTDKINVPGPKLIYDEYFLGFNSWYYEKMKTLGFDDCDIAKIDYKECKSYICEYVKENNLLIK